MKRLLSIVLVCLVATGGVAVNATAQHDKPPELTTEEKAQLKSLVSDAKESYNRGQFASALEQFRAAYDIYPHPDILYRVALCHERLGEDQEAVRHYRMFLAEVPDAPERPRIEKTIEVIESRIAKSGLSVTTQPDGAVVYIDDEANGAAGYTPTELTMKPGNYKVIVEKEGYEPVEELVKISPGQTVALRYQLRSLSPTSNPDVSEKQEGRSGPSAGLITLVSIGIGATVAAVVTYLLWADRSEKIENTPPREVTRETFERWETEQSIFLASFIGSAAIASVSLVWAWYLGRTQARSARLAPVVQPPLAVGFFWQNGPGAGLQIRF